MKEYTVPSRSEIEKEARLHKLRPEWLQAHYERLALIREPDTVAVVAQDSVPVEEGQIPEPETV